jgi:hypothetical protein
MDTTTLLLVIIIVLILFGGGWYGPRLNGSRTTFLNLGQS